MAPWDHCCNPPVRPIDLVVGGLVDPSDLIGREDDLAAVHRHITESNGAVIRGDRRFGKTQMLRKLVDNLRETNQTVIHVSAETEDPEVFTNRVATELGRFDWFVTERKKWSVSFEVEKFGCTVRRTPKNDDEAEPSLEELFGWAARKTAPSTLFVVIDELTVLLQAMSGPEQDASEFLHSLRHARQQNPNLKMVFAGSIGLHHVLPKSGGTLNDLQPQLVDRISDCDAFHLAQRLLLGKGDEIDDSLAWAIASNADRIPYYIHYLVQQVSLLANPTAADVATTFSALLTDPLDPLDPLDIHHYQKRLDGYYGDGAELAEAILDEYAQVDNLSVDELVRRLGASGIEPQPTRSDVLGQIHLLERDHYLTRDATGSSRFSNNVLRLIWRSIRRLQ